MGVDYDLPQWKGAPQMMNHCVKDRKIAKISFQVGEENRDFANDFL